MRQSTDRTIHRLQAFHFYVTPYERFINLAMLTPIKLAPVFSALSVVKIGLFACPRPIQTQKHSNTPF